MDHPDRIEDPIRYLFKVRDTSKTIRDTTEAVMRRAVGNRLGSDVLTTGRVAVASEAKTEIQKILTAYETGVRLVTVELQDVTPPDTVKPAFNEVNESRQDKERTINKARNRPTARSPKPGAWPRKASARPKATRIYGRAYNKSPKFYSFSRTLESYKEKTNKNSVLILTTDSDFYQYIKNANSNQTQVPSAP